MNKAALSLACTLALLSVGCAPSTGGERSTTATPVTSPDPATGSSAPDAAQALSLAGLTLPEDASGVALEPVGTSEAYTEQHLVSFTLSQAAARTFCTTGGLGGSMPTPRLTPSEQSRLGNNSTAVKGSRSCAAQRPDDPSWDRLVLFGPQDPTTVHVWVGRTTR